MVPDRGWGTGSSDAKGINHVDVSDNTRTFAVFHPSEAQNPGLSWLIFPAHGVVIQISGVVAVSWEENLLEHCTCSVLEGVLGECLKK